MKTKFATSFSLAAALLAGSLGVASAQVPTTGETGDQTVEAPKHGKFGRHGRRGHHGGRFFGAKLGITDEQKAQIKTIMETERAKHATLRQQLADSRRAMHEATEGGKFDEAQIRTLAQQRANLMTEMAVSRARIHSTIFNTVLTAEQKAKLEQMKTERATRRAERKERRGNN